MKAVFFLILAMTIMVANARILKRFQIDYTNAAVEQSSSLALLFESMGDCTRGSCNSMCRALHCSGGSCVSPNTCQCYGCTFSDSEEPTPSVPEVPAKSMDCQSSIRMGGDEFCIHGQCDVMCKLIGYHHGKCSSPTSCLCY